MMEVASITGHKPLAMLKLYTHPVRKTLPKNLNRIFELSALLKDSPGKGRWLLFTVIFGMIPIFFRMIVYGFVDGDKTVEPFSAADFIAFGIVLQVSVFNEMKFVQDEDDQWRRLFMGSAALFLTFFSGLYLLVLFSEINSNVNLALILIVSAALDIVSVLLYWAVYDRLSASGIYGQIEEVV